MAAMTKPLALRRPVLRHSRRGHLTRCSATAAEVIPRRQAVSLKKAAGVGKVREAEDALLEACTSGSGRGLKVSSEQEAIIAKSIETLEEAGGVQDPAGTEIISGRWQLLFTSRPGTASPIQRTFTRVDSFTIYQEIDLTGAVNAQVVNVVELGGLGVLRVNADASTKFLPREGFTPRKGKGFPLLGESSTAPPQDPGQRIDFQFTDAAFKFKLLPFPVPYPVPFRRLDDEVKGWIDVTYMSADGRLRLSRGNKGTLFVLSKDPSPKDRLLRAIAEGRGVEEALDALLADGTRQPEARPARSPRLQGTWRQVWSSQADNANWLQKLLSGQAENFQVIGEGRLENVVDLGLLKVVAGAECSVDGPARNGVAIDDVKVTVLGKEFDVSVDRIRTSDSQGRGYVDQLFLDESLRISRGNKGSMFIHIREP